MIMFLLFLERRILLIVAFIGLFCYAQARILNFFQISDLHFDDAYVEGSDDDPTNSCRNNSSFDYQKAGKYGSYSCDSPWPLIESMISKMKEVNASPDFILWTGDSNSHAPNVNWTRVFSNIKRITEELKKQFPSTQIFPSLGNHDSYPSDYFPDNDANFYGRYIEEAGWHDLLVKSNFESFKKGGYYNFSIPKNDTTRGQRLIILVLNTNLYYKNVASLNNLADPCGQLEWLKKQLVQSNPEDRFIILSHVPPGYSERDPVQGSFFNDTYNDKYVDIFKNVTISSKVIAHFYGHVHLDSFRLFTTSKFEPTGVAFISPSVTPLVWNHKGDILGTNPGFRQYQMDSDKSVVVDYEQYYLALDEINNNSSTWTNKWALAYKASEAFNTSKNLSYSQMFSVYRQMSQHPDGELFQLFYRHNNLNHVPNDTNNVFCDELCFTWFNCSIVNLKVDDMNKCLDANAPKSTVASSTITTASTTTKTKRVTTNSNFSEKVIHTTTTTFTTLQPTYISTTFFPKKRLESSSDDAEAANTTAILVSIFGFIGILVLIGFLIFRRIRLQRYRSQEFLLTDGVFNYEGYFQLERP